MKIIICILHRCHLGYGPTLRQARQSRLKYVSRKIVVEQKKCLLLVIWHQILIMFYSYFWQISDILANTKNNIFFTFVLWTLFSANAQEHQQLQNHYANIVIHFNKLAFL